jgi:hypothetical protein
MSMADSQAPLRALEWQKGIVAPIGAMGRSGTETKETQPDRFGQVLGAGMMGLQLMTRMGGNPLGTLISSVPGTAANGGWSTNTYRA